MITLLLVCIFFGINVRIYVDFDKFECVVQVILPLNINAVTIRINLYNKNIFYKINNGKDRQLSLKNKNHKVTFDFQKIKIYSLQYNLMIGSKNDCLLGLYMSTLLGYTTDLIANLCDKYFAIQNLDKIIIPNFKSSSSKLLINIIVKQGIVDIIKSLLSMQIKNKSEVAVYAN